MIYVFIGVLIVLVIFLKLIFVDKLKIKWKTFTKKGFRPNRANFGLYCYTGNQGKGKTYSLIEYIYDNKDNCIFFGNISNISCVEYIYTDDILKSLKSGQKPFLQGNYIYYKGFDGLIDQKMLLDSGLYDDLIKDKQVIFIFDELFSELQKQSRLSQSVVDFLSQLRKRKIIFLTTAQVWAEVPLYFRRMSRFQIDCNMIPLLSSGILIKRFNDAENMKWDDELQEHVAPTLELSVSKTRKAVSECYDTRERITKDSMLLPNNDIESKGV